MKVQSLRHFAIAVVRCGWTSRDVATSEIAGQAANYKVYKLVTGELTRLYGGEDNGDTKFPSETKIDIAILSSGQLIEVDGSFLIYITCEKGLANNEPIQDDDLIRGSSMKYKASEDMQLIIVHAG